MQTTSAIPRIQSHFTCGIQLMINNNKKEWEVSCILPCATDSDDVDAGMCVFVVCALRSHMWIIHGGRVPMTTGWVFDQNVANNFRMHTTQHFIYVVKDTSDAVVAFHSGFSTTASLAISCGCCAGAWGTWIGCFLFLCFCGCILLALFVCSFVVWLGYYTICERAMGAEILCPTCQQTHSTAHIRRLIRRLLINCQWEGGTFLPCRKRTRNVFDDCGTSDPICEMHCRHLDAR